LPAAKKVARDRAVVVDRNKGLSWPVVAERHGIQERQARNIYRAWREENSDREVTGADPVAWLFDTLDRYESVISSLALTAEEADNDAARVGALKAQLAAMDSQAALLTAAGFLPRDLGSIRYLNDVRQLVVEIVEIMRERNVPLEVLREIEAAVGPAPPVGARV
jgi:hypothetical protein